jgi:hypothetical protein
MLTLVLIALGLLAFNVAFLKLAGLVFGKAKAVDSLESMLFKAGFVKVFFVLATVALLEESIFRGALFWLPLALGGNTIFFAVVSALAFAIAHYWNLTKETPAKPVALSIHFFSGLAYCWVFLTYGFLSVWFVHLTYNLIAVGFGRFALWNKKRREPQPQVAERPPTLSPEAQAILDAWNAMTPEERRERLAAQIPPRRLRTKHLRRS